MDNSKLEKESSNFDFGANLLSLREKKMLTQDELGALVGVSGAQIGKYESNENMPRQDKVLKLSKALGVSEAELRGLNVKQNLTSVEKPDDGPNWLALMADAKERIEEWKELYKQQKERADRLQAELDSKK